MGKVLRELLSAHAETLYTNKYSAGNRIHELAVWAADISFRPGLCWQFENCLHETMLLPRKMTSGVANWVYDLQRTRGHLQGEQCCHLLFPFLFFSRPSPIGWQSCFVLEKSQLQTSARRLAILTEFLSFCSFPPYKLGHGHFFPHRL
jgi:hypothetical protein